METGRKPAPKILSQKEFADRMGVQKGTVSKWKAKGLLVLDADGKVLVEETEWKLDQQPAVYRGGTTHRPIRGPDANNTKAPAATPKPAPLKASPTPPPRPAPSDDAPDPADFDSANPNLPMAEAVRRKENFLGLLRKHELEVERREWVRVEDVGKQVEREYAVVRERLLAIPGKLAAKLVGLTRDEINLVLFNEISEALSELHGPASDGDGGNGSSG